MGVLVAYASKHGSTREVADRIADRLRSAGLDVSCQRAKDVESLDGVDAVVLGSGIYAGSWLKPAAKFVDRFASELEKRRVWAFSCGPVGDPPKPDDRPAAADATAAKTGAAENRVFGGVVDRAGLSLVERGVITALKVPDGDYRDFAVIDAWAAGIAGALLSDPGADLADGGGDEVPRVLPADRFWALHTGAAPAWMGGTCELTVHDLGTIIVPSGQLEACDPFVNLGDDYAFVTPIPAGEFPVHVTIADVSEKHDGSHLREAYLSVVLTPADSVRAELIVPEGRAEAPAAEYYGVAVDAGTVAFVDHVAAQYAMPEDSGSWYEDLFDSGEPDSWFAMMDSPDHFREGIANIPLPRARSGENVVLTHSGWGDGFYPVYRTLDADGELTGIHIDLQVAGAEHPDS